MQKRRSLFVRILMPIFLTLAFVVITTFPAFVFYEAAAQAQSDPKVIAGAKQEGKMLLYTSITVDDSRRLINGFNKKYPFMNADLLRAGSEKIISRITGEYRAKKYAADTIMDSFTCFVLNKEGLVMNYVSPESKPYPEGFKDPHGFWTAAILVTRVLGYNTKLVEPRQVPKKYEDLLDPKWKGKLALDSEDNEWMFGQLKVMGREKGIEFMKRLADQNLQIRTGKSLLAQLLAAGEFPIVVTLNGHAVEKLKKSGAPVDWVAIEPVATLVTPMAVLSHAPHPNAAKLFADYVLSVEGQQIVRGMGRIPLHPEVHPDPPRLTQGLKFIYPDPSFVEKVEEYNRLYRDIFLRKTGK